MPIRRGARKPLRVFPLPHDPLHPARAFPRRIGRIGGILRYLLPAVITLPSSSAFAQGRYSLLTFIHTNDLHGRVVSGRDFDDPTRGGLARAATLVRRLRTELPNVLFVDTGDLIHGTPVEFLDDGRPMIDAMNAAGIQVACPGNHEFDKGQEVAQAAMRRAQFPWVSANIVERETGRPFPPIEPYILREVDGVRVAFFGLTTLETVELEWPPLLSRVRFEDPIATARALVPELREKADLVVLLSHLGAPIDAVLAAAVPGIDLILGGHSHTTFTRRVEVGGTILAHAGYFGQAAGRVDLIMKRADDGRWAVESVNGRGGRWWNRLRVRPFDADFPASAVVPLGPEIPLDEAVERSYRPAWEGWRSRRDESLGETLERIADAGAPGDTPLARFLADRLREATGANLAVVDGKWRGALPPGATLLGTVWNAFGGYTGQNILRFEVTGGQIRRFLEQWAASPGGLAVGVSGLTARVSAKETDGGRVREARIGGRPLEEGSRYTIAGVMYVLRRFPSLMETAPASIDMPIEWSRPLVIDAMRRMGRFAPDPIPRLIFE